MTAGHSILAPSSGARRVQCPQSTTLELLYPEEGDSPEAAEGVAAHWAVSEQLSGRLVDVGVVAANGIPLTEEMCRAADLVYDYVTKILAPYGLKPSDGHVEEPVAIPRVHPQSWGTPDYWIYVPQAGLLLLLDFKYGHRIVEVWENTQLVEYLAGVSQAAGVPESCQILAVIVQPRAYHRDGPLREWKTRLVELRGLINISSNAAHEALGPSPRARVGSECRDCRARHACPALQHASYEAMHEARHVVPLELTPAAASLELRFVRQAQQLLQARESGLVAQLEAALRAGKPVPGWRIERGAGRTRWARPDAEVIALGELLGVKVAKAPEAVTPKQAVERGLDPEIVKQMSATVPGGATLVEDDGSMGRRLFG